MKMDDFYAACWGSWDNCQTAVELEHVELLKNQICLQKRSQEEANTLNDIKPRYSSKVLQGNWFEERADLNPPVTTDSWDTSYNTLFKSFKAEEKIGNFLETRAAVEKFKKRGRGVGQSELLEHDGKAYRDNFSTSYDLTYRVLPNLQEPLQRTYYGSRRKYNCVPEQDLTQNYGNVTGYGYVDYIKRKQDEIIQEAMDIPHSNYQCDFGRKQLATDAQRFPRKSADINKPDLRHLDIDLETNWNPQFTHGYRRLNILQQQICK